MHNPGSLAITPPLIAEPMVCVHGMASVSSLWLPDEAKIETEQEDDEMDDRAATADLIVCRVGIPVQTNQCPSNILTVAMIIRITTFLLALGWYLYVYFHYYQQMFHRMELLGPLYFAILLMPYILGMVRQIVRPRPSGRISLIESALLLVSECYITIAFWSPRPWSYVGEEFDKAKTIQTVVYFLVLTMEYIIVKAKSHAKD